MTTLSIIHNPKSK